MRDLFAIAKLLFVLGFLCESSLRYNTLHWRVTRYVELSSKTTQQVSSHLIVFRSCFSSWGGAVVYRVVQKLTPLFDRLHV